MLLSFEKPKKLHSTQEHNAIFSSDCAAPGTYVPNMSDEAARKWRAKKIGGKDPRIEIRKTIGNYQIVLVVKKDIIKLSANGPIIFDPLEWMEFIQIIGEPQNGRTNLTAGDHDR